MANRFGAPTSGVFDIMKFMPKDLPRIDGSIGLDAFDRRAVTEPGTEAIDC